MFPQCVNLYGARQHYYLDVKRRRVLTIHGGAFPEVVTGFNFWERPLFRWVLCRFERFICVSQKQLDVLDSWGVAAQRISIINAYLPPEKSPSSGVFADVEKAKIEGRRILVCAAQYLEHYGLEELTLAMAKLELELGSDAPRLALISYAKINSDYRRKCLALRAKLLPFFEFVDLEPKRVSELLSLGDVFVRPTWWDGDAISVREAAFFGNRLVATDVTTRPEGTLLCKAKNANSLYDALKRCFADSQQGRAAFDHRQSLHALAHVYKDLGVDILQSG